MNRGNANFTFSQVPSVVRPRSVFDRSRTYKTTFDAGYLIPFYLDEVLPGDTFNLRVTSFARLATLIVPFMDNLWMDFFFFFVPNRLVWENWQRFCGEQDNPDDSTDFLVPQVTKLPTVGSLFDYFGLPVGKSLTVSALPFRAYNLIWNEWFRDENLQDSVEVNLDDGPDSSADYSLLKRGKRKSDPFTSALPWPQKGPGVELPLNGNAPVSVKDTDGNFHQLYFGRGAITASAGSVGTFTGLGNSNPQIGYIDNTTGSASITTDATIFPGNIPSNALYADLTKSSMATINSLREAFQVQKWYEQLARGGSRYRELLLSMFGTDTGDARLQRPEYLGGGSTPIQVHAVAQTSASYNDPSGTYDETPQANLAAYGVSGQSGIGFQKSFVEHGHVIGLVSVRGDYTYQQGIDRMWSRQTKFDFYWPAFAHLGEVPILNQELFYSGDDSKDKAAFGYQERWYEYRYGVSKITGKLRSGLSDGSLDYWHLAQYFGSLPTLNESFIQENPPVSRVIAVQNEPQFIFDSVVKCRCARVMPVYSTPGLVDHF